jgi:Tfp pilus assembly protein PilV
MATGSDNSPRGFILAEALIALLIIGVVFLALEGSLTIVLRSIADSEHESVAARMAETRRERAFADVCAPSSGVDSVSAVTVGFTASPDGQLVRMAQTSRYRQKAGDRVEHYDALGACQ